MSPLDSWKEFFSKTSTEKKIRVVALAVLGSGVLISSLAIVGWIVWYQFAHPQAPVIVEEKVTEEDKAHERKPASGHHDEASTFHVPYELPNMMVTISNRSGTRSSILQFTMVFDCGSTEVLRVFQRSRAKLRDVIYQKSAEFNLEQLTGAKGISQYKEAVLDTVSQEFDPFAPADLVIKDWVIQ